MSQTKVKSGLLNFPDQTDFVKLPSGTTAQRPSSPEEGYSRYNTTDDKLEYWNGTVWQQLPALDPPTLTSVDYPGNDLAADPAGGQTILINGTNFVSGISVEIGSTEVSSVTLNSTTQLAITSPALTAGDYDVTVTNLDAGTITALDFISYNGVPSWVTASGSLGSLNFGEAISTISLSATEPDGGNVSYAITSGALPTGLTLSSSGDITGTMPSGSAETIYSFTVTATDDENQSTDRSFTITGVVPFVNNQNFTTVTYTGAQGTQPRSITGVGFKPDFVWIKERTSTSSSSLADVVRGAGLILQSDLANAEINVVANLVSFDSDGFTIGNSNGVNETGQDYVAWCWKAGGTPVSNTDGSITSQVSANTKAGFSIVTFTGNGVESTVGHGLNETPAFIIVKNRTNDTENSWAVWNKNQSSQSQFLALNGTDSYLTNSGVFGSTPHNSSVFNVGNLRSRSGINYIAYVFAEISGFSKFGSYTGTGSNRVFNTGFEPAFLMFKSTSQSSDWFIFDNKRDSSNRPTKRLKPNLSDAETTSTTMDISFLKNGFSLGVPFNDLNRDFVYIAFAENPNTQVPTKADSFNTVTYTGNGSQQSITGVGFKPDLSWFKARSVNYDHQLHDSIRGAGFGLISNSDGTGDFYNTVTSFDSDGFTVNASNYIGTNASGQTFVSWNWKAGVIPYINTDGSTESVVIANQASGFSIVKHRNISSSGNYTVGHGLSQAPELIITKNITTDGYRWTTYNVHSGTGYYMGLNEDRAATSYSLAFPVAPDSNVFTLNSGWPHPINNESITYCFHSIPGFSKIGTYSGNGSTQSINVGFDAAFVMFKRTDSTGQWTIIDDKRNNGDNWLYADLVNAEGVNINRTTLTSTGFDLDGSPSSCNESGSTYIYIAFANQY